ncbi:AI-2E family transporter [Ammoniphilus sp. CFH 90114]|uniref:AI-2E family transporter n=1 Tax=Ammoniphilus sp. CFH 90114 TaxID=2493665 RepID=UPI00100E88FD|nr:AI-2E family transporter [Ammoniphilus sp. CFH 90114]RXT14771.1 AI-2E family transporter [Ammoniphilus sp. CFH 90114]
MEQRLRLLMFAGVFALLSGTAVLLVHLWPHVAWVWLLVKAVITPFIISLIIAYLLNPIVNLLHERNVPRGMAVIIIYFTFILMLVVFLMNLIPAFIQQSRELTEHIPELIQTYQLWLTEFHSHKYQLPEGVRIGIEQSLQNSEKRTADFFAGILDGAGGLIQKTIHLFVIPFLVFYMLKDMLMLQRGILLLVPRARRKVFSKLFHEIDVALGNYISGQLIICSIVGLLAYIGYWLIKMPYALILALIITITNIIPYIGPIIGAAPSILVALTISWEMTVLVVIVNLAVQILEGNLISPLIMGKRLHLHPLLIIFALLLGGEVGGLIGLIFAVPIVAILRVIIHHVIIHLVKH